MADPDKEKRQRDLKAAWGRIVQRYPEARLARFGDAPWDVRFKMNVDAWSAYQAALRGRGQGEVEPAPTPIPKVSVAPTAVDTLTQPVVGAEAPVSPLTPPTPRPEGTGLDYRQGFSDVARGIGFVNEAARAKVRRDLGYAWGGASKALGAMDLTDRMSLQGLLDYFAANPSAGPYGPQYEVPFTLPGELGEAPRELAKQGQLAREVLAQQQIEREGLWTGHPARPLSREQMLDVQAEQQPLPRGMRGAGEIAASPFQVLDPLVGPGFGVARKVVSKAGKLPFGDIARAAQDIPGGWLRGLRGGPGPVAPPKVAPGLKGWDPVARRPPYAAPTVFDETASVFPPAVTRAPTAPTATARSIDELIEAGGRIPQKVSFRISLRRTEGANNLDYSQEIIRVRNLVDSQLRQFGDGPVPERLVSSIDEGLNIDVPPTLREASSVLTQASEEAARLGQRKLREADELLDQAKADQIQRGIDAIGLTDAPTAARGAEAVAVVAPRVARGAFSGTGPTAARDELEDIISQVPEIAGLSRRSVDAVRRQFDQLLSGEYPRGRNRKTNIAYIADKLGRKTEDIESLVTRTVEEVGMEGVRAYKGRFYTSDWITGLLNTHLNKDFLRRGAETLAWVPGMETILKRVATPASIAGRKGNEGVAEVVGYRLGQEQMLGDVNAKLGLEFKTVVEGAEPATGLRGMLRRSPRLFDVTEEGELLLANGKKMAFGDVAENPTSYLSRGLITEAQHKWITEAHVYIDELARGYQLATGRKLIVKKGREHYWPRFVKNDDGSVGISETVFSKQSPSAERILETQGMGIEKGVKYVADPLEQLKSYANSVNKMTLDGIFEQRALTKKILEKNAAGEWVEGAATMASKVGKLTTIEKAARIKDLPAWQAKRGVTELEFTEKAKRQLASLGGRSGGIIGAAETAAAIPKLLVTGVFDTGMFLIQGATLLGYRPNRFARSTRVAFQTLLSRSPEDHFGQWMRAYEPKLRDGAAHGVDIGDISEFYEALETLARIPVLGKPLAAVGGRFGAGFHAFMNVGRLEMFDAMATVTRKRMVGKSQLEVAEELRRIGRISNTLMGGTSTKSLGLSATQRQVENGFLLFAPRYTRAFFGAVAHMAGTNSGAREAQAAIGQMLFAGAAVIAGANGAIGAVQGKSDEEIWKDIERALDPRSGRAFASIRIGNQYYGFGGTYRAGLALLLKTIPIVEGVQAVAGGRLGEPSPTRWAKVLEDVEHGDYVDAVMQNPIVSFWRARQPLTIGPFSDLIDEEDFIGNDFTVNAFIEDPSKLLTVLGKRVTPFPIQAVLEVLSAGTNPGDPVWQRPAEAALAGGMEFGGGRAVPASLYELRAEVGEEIRERVGGPTYEDYIRQVNESGESWEAGEGWRNRGYDLTKSPESMGQAGPRVRLGAKTDPQYQALTEKIIKASPERAEYEAKEDEEREKLYGLLASAHEASKLNEAQPGKLYHTLAKKHQTAYYTRKAVRDEEARANRVFGVDRDPEGPIAIAEDEYYTLMVGDDGEEGAEERVTKILKAADPSYTYTHIEKGGIFQPQEYKRRIAYLHKEWSKAFIDDVKAVSRAGLPDFERQRREDMDYIREAGWWEVEEVLAAEAGLEKELKIWQALPRYEQDEYGKRSPEISPKRWFYDRVIKKKSDRRQWMRRRDDKLDTLLRTYGVSGVSKRIGVPTLMEL